MNRNMIIAGVFVLVLIVVIILVLSIPPKETSEPVIENGVIPPENLESEILRGIEAFIKGDKDIINLLAKSEKHKKKFAQLLQNEPAFTLGLDRILAENLEFDELALSFASNFASPELYPILVDYLKIKGVDVDHRKLAHRILASGGDEALKTIFSKHYDEVTGRISDVKEIREYVQYFPHYYQLKFWLEKYTSESKDDLLSKTGSTNFNNTVSIYSPASMKTQIKLFSDIENVKQQEIIIWALAQNRIRPQWYDWFVPMFAKAVSEKNQSDTKKLFESLIEVIKLPRRDKLVTLLENWLRNNISETIGYKILSGAVQQGRTDIEKYRKSNSLNTNAPTDETDSPDPDEKLPPILKAEESSAKAELFENLLQIYSKMNSVNEGFVKSRLDAYNFEIFSKMRKKYFVKPYLFEIAQNADVAPGADTWRSSFYKLIFDKKIAVNVENAFDERNLWLHFNSILGAIWDLKEIDRNSKAELFKSTKLF
ncbi:MAG: hypothetical protein K8S87_04090 [Planctomycetes bacterium]|nr:hypothetical protein [Planctomycetota bacterium]